MGSKFLGRSHRFAVKTILSHPDRHRTPNPNISSSSDNRAFQSIRAGQRRNPQIGSQRPAKASSVTLIQQALPTIYAPVRDLSVLLLARFHMVDNPSLTLTPLRAERRRKKETSMRRPDEAKSVAYPA